MTWEEAIEYHATWGHAWFYERAKECGKSEQFIRNVCNHKNCKE